MNERMPWPPRTAVAVVALIGAIATLGFALLALGSPVGGLAVALAGWLSAGLLYTVWRTDARP